MIEEVSESNMIDLDDELITCHQCGREIRRGDTEHINGWYYCEDCASNFVECEDCGRLVHEDDTQEINGRVLCDNCASEYRECPTCHELYHRDDMIWDDDDEEYYCNECYETRPRIYGYHDYPRAFKFYKASTEVKPPHYVGAELECENEDRNQDVIEYLYDHLHLICAHDGSLEGWGAMELVFDPHSRLSWYENGEEIKKAFEYMVEEGYRSHEPGTCGLHFHVSRPYQEEMNKINIWSSTCSEEDKKRYEELQEKQDLIISRIILLMETYKEQLIKFSRRKSMEWCKFLSDSGNGEIKSLYTANKKKKSSMGHHTALNLENTNTIEFRIFRGTLNFDTFMASMELVDNIVTLCSDLSMKIEDITWEKLISNGSYVKSYCDEKDIHTDKLIEDHSIEEKNREKILERALKKAYKKVIKIYNKEVKKLTSGLVLRVNDNIPDLMNITSTNYNNMQRLSYMVDKIDTLLRCSKNNCSIDEMKYGIKNFINSYDLSFIDWNSEDYIDIKRELDEIISI